MQQLSELDRRTTSAKAVIFLLSVMPELDSHSSADPDAEIKAELNTPERVVSPNPMDSRRETASPRKAHKGAPSSMPKSPLQQVNVESAPHFKLKVESLYERLFNEKSHDAGYWIEFFLLPLNKQHLSKVLRAAAPLNKHEETVQTLVMAAVANLEPRFSTSIIINALGVLEVVFREALDLSADTPTTSVVHVLVGIDRASKVFDELTSKLLVFLNHKSPNVVHAAIGTVLGIARSSWGTQLNTLFATKNFFASCIALIDTYVDRDIALQAFSAIGVLTALDVYDVYDNGSSIYLQRINDYVDEAVMVKIIALAQRSLSHTKISTVASTTAENQRLSSWFTNWFSKSAERIDVCNEKDPYENVPELNYLSLHFFILHNSMFAQGFASSPALITLITSSVTEFESSKKSGKSFDQSWLNLLILRHLLDNEFDILVENARAVPIRIEASKLASNTSQRVPLAGILDLLQVGLRSFGCQKKPNTVLLEQLARVLKLACRNIVNSKIYWKYYWPQLWKTSLGLIKHLSVKSVSSSAVSELLNSLVGLASHRDIIDEENWTFLVYSILQNADLITQITEAFPELTTSPCVVAAKAMIAQYELSKNHPDLVMIVKQGILAAGTGNAMLEDTQRYNNAAIAAATKKVVKTVVSTKSK